MPGIKQLGRGLRKPLCSIIVTTKTSLLKNNNKSGILTSRLEAERQGGYREAGEKEVGVAGTQRCPAEEPSTIQNDTRSPLSANGGTHVLKLHPELRILPDLLLVFAGKFFQVGLEHVQLL